MVEPWPNRTLGRDRVGSLGHSSVAVPQKSNGHRQAVGQLIMNA
jgi:hypothetical protein